MATSTTAGTPSSPFGPEKTEIPPEQLADLAGHDGEISGQRTSRPPMDDRAKDIEAEEKAKTSGLKSFLSGGFGGIACVLVGALFMLPPAGPRLSRL